MNEALAKWMILLFMVISSSLLISIFELSSLILCKDRVYPVSSVRQMKNVITVNGKLIDISKLTNTTIINTVKAFPGLDLSASFPTFTILGRRQGQSQLADPDMARCVGSRTSNADRFLQRRLTEAGYSVQNDVLVNCPLPNGAPGQCFFTQNDKDELLRAISGDLVFSDAEIDSRRDIRRSDVLVIVRGRVYDVGKYLNIATDINNGIFTPKQDTAFFAEPITSFMIRSAGKDMTQLFETLPEKEDLIKCFNKLFYVGVSQAQSVKIGCTLVQPVQFAAVIAILLVILPKYLMAFFMPFGVGKIPISDAYLMIAINCVAERASSIQTTIESALLSNYRDQQKLLVIVCDGELQHNKSGLTTVEVVLDILGFRGRESLKLEYASVGGGSRASNSAILYSGHVIKNGRKVPYVVISKIGSDEYDLGERGQRDTLVMLLSFLNKLLGDSSKLSPLEYGLYASIRDLKFDPRRFEYLLMLNAGMIVDGNMPSKLVNRLDTEEKLAMICAQTKTRGFALFQAYPNFMKRHLSTLYKSVWGSVYYTAGNSYVMRLKYSDGSPCVLRTEIIRDMADGENPQKMNEKVLNFESEDQHLGVRVLRYEPGLRVSYEPSAMSSAEPVPFGRLLEIERNQHNATFATLREASRIGGIKSKAVANLSTLTMILLPFFTLYCYYLLARFIMNPYMFSMALVVAPFILLHLIAFISATIRLNFGLAFSVIVYLTIGIPFYQVIVPLYSFATMDTYKRVHRSPVFNETQRHPCIYAGIPAQMEKYTLNEWKTMGLERQSVSSEATVLKEQIIVPTKQVSPLLSMQKPASPVIMTKSIQQPAPVKVKSTIKPASSEPAKSTFYKSGVTDNLKRDTIRQSSYDDYKRSQLAKFMSRPESVMSQDTVHAPISSLLETKQKSFLNNNNNARSKSPVLPSDEDSVPLRAMSMTRSDYESELGGHSNHTSMANIRNTRYSHIEPNVTQDFYNETGVSREEIKEEIREILQDADLNKITRREVKDRLIAAFGEQTEVYYNDYINICIEEFTLERLALL